MSNIPDYNVIFYHKGCADGLLAAFAYYNSIHLNLIFKGSYSKDPTAFYYEYGVTKMNIYFIGISPDGKPDHRLIQETEDVEKDHVFIKKKICFLDVMSPQADIEKLLSKAKCVKVIDHHEGMYTRCVDLQEKYINFGFIHSYTNSKGDKKLEKSAGELSWDIFNSPINSNMLRPWIIDVIADRDVWRWTYPNSKELGAYIWTFGLCNCEKNQNIFNLWIDICKSSDIDKLQYIESGKLLLKQEKQRVDVAIKQARKVIMKVRLTKEETKEETKEVFIDKEYNVYLVNCEHGIASEVLNTLCKEPGIDFAVSYRYSFENKEFWLSLRSIGLNLIPIAMAYNGNGHPNACGCTLYGTDKLHQVFTLIPKEIKGTK